MIDINYAIDNSQYNVNSLGYRSIEFDQIDWKNSFIIQGCSQVFGEENFDDSKIVSSYLSELLESPVINLGVPGSGMDVQYSNTLELIEQNIKPKGIFIVYPNLDRYTLYDNGKRKSIGGWSETEHLKWILNGNSRTHNIDLVRGYRLFWKLFNVPLYEWSHLPENNVICRTDTEWYKNMYFTDSYKNGHWGPMTTKGIANILYEIYLAT